MQIAFPFPVTTVPTCSPRLASPMQTSAAGALDVAMTPDVARLLAANAVVAVGVSGGKDSGAVALAVANHLDAIGHTGPRVLIHADLGIVEWKDSLPSCERLAAHLGWELIVVRRAAGDLMQRWQGRWAANVARYADLSCVKLILPWSTPALKFCTSEMKVQTIASALKKRFPGQDVLNVTGVRAQESSARSKMPVSQAHAGLSRKDMEGITWNAILHWDIDSVFARIAQAGLALHEAYTKYSMTRVSCAFCVMSSGADLIASSTCEDNHDLYRIMVDLEIESTFGFQGGRWLADVAPHLLTPAQLAGVARAKVGARLRQEAEALLPPHLLYTKGWPTALPTWGEAQLVADIRQRVAAAVGLRIQRADAGSVMARYSQLLGEAAPGAQNECEFGTLAQIKKLEFSESNIRGFLVGLCDIGLSLEDLTNYGRLPGSRSCSRSTKSSVTGSGMGTTSTMSGRSPRPKSSW